MGSPRAWVKTPVAPEVPAFARYRVNPGEPVSLAGHDASDTGGYAGPDEAYAELSGLVRHIAHLQARRYAEERRSVLVVPVEGLLPEERGRSR